MVTVDSEREDALDAAEQALAGGDVEGCRRELARAEALAGERDAELAYLHGLLLYEEGQEQAARQSLERALELDPQLADAHYALAAIHQDAGEREAMIQRWLRVRDQDARDDRASGLASPDKLDRIEAVAREVLDGLPEELGARLKDVPVVLESRPSRALVSGGIDPRALGLFEGQPEGGPPAPQPTRIVLYTHNLLAEFGEGDQLDNQIEITLLHEIGHFFGLDEGQVEDLGLR